MRGQIIAHLNLRIHVDALIRSFYDHFHQQQLADIDSMHAENGCIGHLKLLM
jgi:hypothetical protein